jgi:hypothetical protein
MLNGSPPRGPPASGNWLTSAADSTPKGDSRSLVLISDRGQAHLHGQNIARIEARLDALQIRQAFEQQPRANQQNYAQSNFHRNEPATQAIPFRA